MSTLQTLLSNTVEVPKDLSKSFTSPQCIHFLDAVEQNLFTSDIDNITAPIAKAVTDALYVFRNHAYEAQAYSNSSRASKLVQKTARHLTNIWNSASEQQPPLSADTHEFAKAALSAKLFAEAQFLRRQKNSPNTVNLDHEITMMRHLEMVHYGMQWDHGSVRYDQAMSSINALTPDENGVSRVTSPSLAMQLHNFKAINYHNDNMYATGPIPPTDYTKTI